MNDQTFFANSFLLLVVLTPCILHPTFLLQHSYNIRCYKLKSPFSKEGSESKTVLVTGGTGFLGTHIISQLLEKGYIVRATARSPSKLQTIFPEATSEQVQVIAVPSLTVDHSTALKEVDALIHSASHIFGGGVSGQDLYSASGAYEGTVSLVKQAIASGVKKIILTGTFVDRLRLQSSMNSMTDFQATFGTLVLTEADFGSVTAETFDLNHEGMRVYQEAKTLADKAIWDLALSNPKIDFTILPPAIFGPQFSTDMLFAPEYPPIPIGHMIDVRNAARAHVLALSIPPVPGRHKRFIISNGTFLWKDIASLIRRRKPELAGRLPKETSVPGPQTSAPIETTFAKEVLAYIVSHGTMKNAAWKIHKFFIHNSK
ncbi:hypothetical protein F5879DRAFT_1023374 [Lentinula edodes]|uniref:uncharacterized protein n=1 Tax=Lentinula edodes TaxID=5353 RepID=UPI001E8CA4F9|nr:uncharacterized protein C8R40DRAFT_1065208 [Lentinula edodes]KAH7881558.1 hypothetical protein C8R40DRAFT_1065208 [Lentinula edodes]KAJ3903680.1 hypothetical protein F5879DRAFT_1023374 [Lentinula edodes]